ncbi:ABC transporter substrate-binding protein [Rhodococcus sp. 11-3]|uniref:ABC transporter substrate-binding protein n=1 Tax=Rhodococcus sp. 11-3 TaxID=2854796 RepID=UPI00203BD74F|nr:ABC transporter substrate-binding protein [Rhodococcus sp. 11-3]USC13519.1 ABC transporter substrate-binding protein [Rhodococcus sp. 11-3]
MPAASRSRAVTCTVALAAVAALGLAGCAEATDDPASSIVRTTTRIAGAAVVGIERDTTTACALPSPPDPGQPAGGTRSVIHTGGVSEVPADPQRIVVLDAAAMDAVCALGLWERVVGTTTDVARAEYLGTGIATLPSVGTTSAPDVALIDGVEPDLILGSSADPELYRRLGTVAPTVLVGSDPVFWRQQFLRAGETLGRSQAAGRVLDNYRATATDVGKAVTASQTQASIVRFNGDGAVVEGTASFAGQVLADAGAARPPAQRFGVQDGRADAPLDEADPAAAEGDLIYVRFAGEDGVAHGSEVMDSEAWLELGAVTDSRLFAVDDLVWSTPGPVAAKAVLTDVRNTLNGYSN